MTGRHRTAKLSIAARERILNLILASILLISLLIVIGSIAYFVRWKPAPCTLTVMRDGTLTWHRWDISNMQWPPPCDLVYEENPSIVTGSPNIYF